MGNNLEKIFDNISTLIEGENDEISKENANMNADTPAGMQMKVASETQKEFTREKLLSEKTLNLVDSGLIHIHDMDYYPTKSLTCLQHPLDKVLKYGARVGHCAIRPAKRIETASAVACIMLQGVQNEMHGGQSIPAFDFYMAPFVRMAFEEEVNKIYDNLRLLGVDFVEVNPSKMQVKEYEFAEVNGTGKDKIKQQAINNTVRRVHQAMESFIHNMNTMHSRGGNQVVFSSINYGTDTSPEGRCVIRELLKSTYKGVGNGETPIFPIQIFKLKKGVNKEECDPNYDLLNLVCETTSRRMFPNFLNLDMSLNKDDRWKADDPKRYEYEVATMGCRTRVYGNICGEKGTIGRGNLSFTTINLPGLALKAKKEEPIDTMNYFMHLLVDTMNDVAEQLYERYQFQTTAKLKQFPMLTNGLWKGSEEYDAEDYMGDLLKQGTLSIGFIGLAECLIVLTGKHHGEDNKAQKLGLEIVSKMAKKIEDYKTNYELNYSLLATPAEGLSGKFTKMDRNKYGVIENVTDKEYYTNSNHIPVWYQCSASHKARIEGPYHKLTDAGHIFYVEMDGDLTHNPEAIKGLIKYMDRDDIGYMALNHTRNRCIDCGFENSDKDLEECPKCGSKKIDTIARITGYLVGSINNWNNYKKSELRDRVSHTKVDAKNE